MISTLKKKFVLHWGEMGSRWGLSRVAAEIQALLFVSEKPITASELAETLDVARSNISVAVRELERWDLIRATHILGDRREHYEAVKDPWQILQLVVQHKKEREFDPAIQVLGECVEGLKPHPTADAYAAERLEELRSALLMIDGIFELLRGRDAEAVLELVRAAAKSDSTKARAAEGRRRM